MTTHQISGSGNAGAAPVACSLTSAGLAKQGHRWESLAARAMTEHAETGDGLRLWLRAEPGVEEELRTLVAVEQECCPWAEWTVTASAGQLVLDVRATGEGAAALHSMFATLRPARPPAD